MSASKSSPQDILRHLTPRTGDGEALSQLDAAKKNSTVQSMASGSGSGCLADDCNYILITEEKVYFDGVRSRSDTPTVVVQNNTGQSVPFIFGICCSG
jgi:hypothetical protein